MELSKIDRINELARKSKKEGLNEEEKKEQEEKTKDLDEPKEKIL